MNSVADLIDLVIWAYGKLHHAKFSNIDDALMLDRMKNYLEHEHNAEEIGDISDSERLQWMSERSAFVGWNREGEWCSVWRREDEEPVCGFGKFFGSAREAIDAAMAHEREK